MSNLMKRLICIVLALMMVMALCACGASEDEGTSRRRSSKTAEDAGAAEQTTEATEAEPTLVGEWEAYLDMTDYLNDMLAEEIGEDDIIDDFSVRMTMKFKDDGTVTLKVDKDHLEDVVNDFADKFWTVFLDIMAEEYGMDVKELETTLADSGVTKDTLVEEMDIESAFEDVEDMKGYWMLDGDELFIAEDEDDVEDADPVEIEFDDNDTFSIIGGDGLDDLDEEMIELFLPIVFERI